MKILSMVVLVLLISQMVQAEEKVNDIWGNEAGYAKDESQSKMLRHMAKQRAMQANMTAEERKQLRESQKSGCGSVNIGNIDGAKDNAETVVIIKGDVINANNNCK
jgi:hypothetical protein